MAQFPQLPPTDVLNPADEVLLRQGTTDKRINFSLASAITWCDYNERDYRGTHKISLVFTLQSQVSYFDGYLYQTKAGITLPHTSTSEDPNNDPSLEVLVKSLANVAYETKSTLEVAVEDTLAKEGASVRVTDRADYIFDWVSGEAPNGFDIVAHNTLPLQLKLRVKGIMSAEAFGAKLDWNGSVGTDDTLAMQHIHALGVNYSLDGKMARISDSLEFANGQRIYPLGGGIFKENTGYIYTTNGQVKSDIIVYGGFYDGNELASLADFRGAGSGYNDSGKSIVFLDGLSTAIDTAFNFDNSRSCSVERGRYACRTGVNYTNKSAECNITGALFAKDENFSTIGTTGLKSFAGVDGYPEGLTVSNTLFYRFEYNLNIEDLYIGKFTDNYFDSSGVDAKRNVIKSNVST